MGRWSLGWPVFLACLAVGAAVRHLWLAAAVAVVLAVIAGWLISLYERR